MYGLPIDVDLGFFEKAVLVQFCVGKNELILNFDRDISIAIESKIQLRSPDGSEKVIESAVSAPDLLIDFLSKPVVEACGAPDGTLKLNFAHGGEIMIYDSLSDYESYQIRHGKNLIVV